MIAALVLLALLAAAEWWTRPPHGRRNAPQLYRHPRVLGVYLTRLNREDAP